MPVMDEFQEERDLMKTRSTKEKLQYFWEYYKWHTIGLVVGVIAVISLVYNFFSQKEIAFYAVLMNMTPFLTADEYREGFAEKAEIDQKKYKLYFDSDMHASFGQMDQATLSTSQKMLVYVAAGDMDAMLADTSGMNRYAYNQVLVDLRDFLTAEEYEKYEPYFYYMDRALIPEDATSMDEIDYPEDPGDASSMKDPVPVGIKLGDCPGLRANYAMADPSYFCVLVNNKHMDLCHVFLDYVWNN